ncbi:PDZ domain-containing protein [Jeotgalibacillus sp. ET6]|uniref:PDZ domain-containing protein n=1 Tax=Jeotgalibacillus sp. ET6 TaxID=3037260 RepID=UPI0024182F0E|nr:PDZ domain-containing protein [Jeotgalibacillus sp. ET6]MDG5471646.1 PDZ domain-containing protein [Jeotgalibacillus sp. ET6]
MNDWMQEIGTGALMGLINPVLYIAILAALIAGVLRVKRERNDLRVSLLPPWLELKSFVGLGIPIGLVLSAMILAAGVEVSVIWVYAVSALMALIIVSWQFRLLSPALFMPAAAAVLYALYLFELPLPEWAALEIPEGLGTIGVASIVMGLLLLAEGLLIRWSAVKKTSPRTVRTPRGLKAGAFFTKRLWFVPLFFLVPAGSLEAAGGWWPIFTYNGTSWAVFAVPFILGYQLTVVHDLPEQIIKQASKEILWLSALVTVLGVAGFWAPYLYIAAFAVAFAGRIFLALRTRSICRQSGYYFINKEKGVMVVDIIPGTPAEKMGLKRGEIIHKLNGILVRDERDLYAALQKNRAHCKLEVLDHQGQIRFVQRALHEGQHHQLGIIMVEDPMRNFSSDSA